MRGTNKRTRQNIRSILVFIILATVPCYLVAFIALFAANGTTRERATATPRQSDNPVLATWTPIDPDALLTEQFGVPSQTPFGFVPTWTPLGFQATWTPFGNVQATSTPFGFQPTWTPLGLQPTWTPFVNTQPTWTPFVFNTATPTPLVVIIASDTPTATPTLTPTPTQTQQILLPPSDTPMP